MLPLRFKAVRWNRAEDGATTVRRDNYRFATGLKRRTEESYRTSKPKYKGDGHVATETADGMQEFDIFGVCGYPQLKISSKWDVYEVCLVVKRPLGAFFTDIIITNAMIVVACASFYDIASPDLSARMSISLTVMLTLASYMSERPSAIEKLPHLSVHDWNEIFCWLLLIIVSVQNVFAVILCGAESQVVSGAGEVPSMMADYFEQHRDGLCQTSGWCGSRELDCHSMSLVFVLQVLIALYTYWWVRRNRIAGVIELARMRAEHQKGWTRKEREGGVKHHRETTVEGADLFNRLLNRPVEKSGISQVV